MRVNFIICGTQKGGTSALDGYLREHPEICMAREKETHFFDNEYFFQRRNPDYADYHAFFETKPGHRLLGEATPVYMYWHDAPRRIWKYNSDMKLIVLLRNPIERAYSHWNMERARDAETLCFGDAIRQEQTRCTLALPFQHRWYSYVDRGFYLAQIRRLWQFFPKKNVLVLKSEYLREEPENCLGEVCDFLGVIPLPRVDHKDIHSLPYRSRISEDDRKYLGHIYEYEIKNIERVFGWNCSDWLV